MSIINFIAIITDVGMWVTPTRLHNDDSPTIFLELSTFKHQTNNAFSSFLNINNNGFKNGKAAHLKNEPLLFTGWHKAALETKLIKN
ncbi:MAG: hypothetical protein ABIR06_03190 [Cyclobacteriaceae bacterium]